MDPLSDVLSDVLSLSKPRTHVSAGFEAGGAWAIRYPRHDGIKCYAVVSGECWLLVEGVPDPVRLGTGDCFLLPNGRPFRLASDLALAPVEAETVYAAARHAGVVSVNGGGDFFLVGGRFTLAGGYAGVLLGVLPPIVHVREEADKAALRWCVEQMRQEMRERRPGGALVAQHLAHMLLVQALRAYMADGSKGGVGWLFALADERMGAAIGALHAHPARRWTVQDLAGRAGMSRSSFALRFKRTVGTSPMDYLTRWRMLLAADRLANSCDSVCAIAVSLGYESESAFSAAFKRVMACPPRRYGRGRHPASPPHDRGEATRADRLEPVASPVDGRG